MEYLSSLLCISLAMPRSINWPYLSEILPEDRDRIQSPECCVLNKKQDDGYVQKRNNFINIPSSQTFRSHLPACT
jgi:hypothetical protein